MNHKFDVLTVSIFGECTECKQFLQTRKAISLREMRDHVKLQDNPEYGGDHILVHKLEEAYKELDKHKCSVST